MILLHIKDLFLSLSLPRPLSLKSINMSSGEDFKKKKLNLKRDRNLNCGLCSEIGGDGPRGRISDVPVSHSQHLPS